MNLKALLIAAVCGLLAALYTEMAQKYFRRFKWSL